MKTLLVLFLFLLSLLSCQDTNRSGKDVSEDMEEMGRSSARDVHPRRS